MYRAHTLNRIRWSPHPHVFVYSIPYKCHVPSPYSIATTPCVSIAVFCATFIVQALPPQPCGHPRFRRLRVVYSIFIYAMRHKNCLLDMRKASCCNDTFLCHAYLLSSPCMTSTPLTAYSYAMLRPHRVAVYCMKPLCPPLYTSTNCTFLVSGFCECVRHDSDRQGLAWFFLQSLRRLLDRLMDLTRQLTLRGAADCKTLRDHRPPSRLVPRRLLA